ncbi:helix-turn-helix domain-containing protein [Nonomuraea salmonea]|uniref:Helix-turn-helix domain-containing protein n=1 Tax=Nonomuraea salmonea TaxID=46181 RepID=A0ABV5P4C0_9ACTN
MNPLSPLRGVGFRSLKEALDTTTPEQVRHARALLTRPDATVPSIARLLNVSRSTIYKYVPDLATGRPAVEQPAGRAELETGG